MTHERCRLIETQRMSHAGWVELIWKCREREQADRNRERRAKYALPYPRRDLPQAMFSVPVVRQGGGR